MKLKSLTKEERARINALVSYFIAQEVTKIIEPELLKLLKELRKTVKHKRGD